LTLYVKFTIIRTIRKPRGQSQAGETKQPDLPSVRPIAWIASSKDDLSALPREVKASFGFRLYELQQGKTPLDMKPLPQFGAGVYELRESFERNAYRVMHVVNLTKALYVLHAFMKKSKSGIGLPKPDAELIAQRLRRARELEQIPKAWNHPLTL
jgi:phage-related protein